MSTEPVLRRAEISSNVVRWGYLLQELAVFLGLTLMVLLSGSTSKFVDQDLLTASAILLSAAALLWLAFGQHSPAPLAWPLLVWVAVYIISLFFSIDPDRSVNQMLLMGVSIFLFLLAADLVARGWPAELLIKGVLLAGAFVVCFELIDAASWYRAYFQAGSPAGVIYRPDSANVVAMFMNLMIMLALARLLMARSMFSKIFLGLLELASAGILYLTSSRAGWLGTLAGLGGMAFLYWRSGKLNLAACLDWLRKRRFFGIVLILFIAGGLMIGAWLFYRQSAHPTHSPTISNSRTEYWAPAWQAFLNHPIFGQGAFTYSNAFIESKSIPPDILYVHAHGSWISLLAERGLVGVLSLAWLLAAMGLLLWSRYKHAGHEELAVIIGAMAAATAFMVHSLFDGFTTEPLGLWVLVIALGAAVGFPAPASQKAGWRRRPWWVLLLLGGVWFELWTVTPLFKGVALANSNQWEQAQISFQQAVQRDPHSVITYQQLGLASSAKSDPRSIDVIGIPALEKAISLDPDYAMNYANLGAFYANDIHPEMQHKALDEFNKSIQLAPRCAVCYLNLGIVAERLNDAATAREAYDKALYLNPDWVDAYFWRSTPLRSEDRAAWISQHPPMPAPTLQQLEADLTEKPAYALPYAKLAEAYLDLNRITDAERLLKIGDMAYISDTTPAEHLELLWAEADQASRRGDLQTAIARGEQAINGYRMQGINGPGTFGLLYYAPLMFRRPAMAMEMVPQLTQILLPDLWGKRMATLGKWYVLSGQNAKAQQVYSSLMELIPDFDKGSLSDYDN